MSTFDGYFLRQFGRKIRADRFANQEDSTKIQLLSHCHADHVVGLSSRQLRGSVYCSEATRDILLRTATASERVHADVNGVKSDDYYSFANLNEPVLDARGKQVTKNGKKLRLDVLKPLTLNERHDFSDVFGSALCITLIDANHCPGAVMFLIESPTQAILYTGDVRAEAFLINSLTHNPVLSDYLHRFDSPASRTLDEIYLDTSAAMTRSKILSKREGVEEALKLFDLFPSNTRFFLNVWTWGYEELLRGIAHKYRTRIHLDDYKARIYGKPSVSDHDRDYSSMPASYPVLASLGTSVFQSTRFHACERRWKCPHIRDKDAQGCYDSPEAQAIWEKNNERALFAEVALEERNMKPHVVFVNPAESTPHGWEAYKAKLSQQIQEAKKGAGNWPSNILVPLARHSTLPELQELVALFKPRSIYPNTIYPEANGADYLMYAEQSFFGELLAPGGQARLQKEAEAFVATLSTRNKPTMRYLPTDGAEEDEESPAVKAELAGKFATVAGRLGNGFLRDNFDHLTDVNDIELLMLEPEAPLIPSKLNRDSSRLLQPQTSIISSGRTASSGIDIPLHPKASTSALLPSLPLPPSPKQPALAKDPSTAPTGAESHAQDSHEGQLSSTSKAPDKLFLAGQSFYFCADLQDEMKEWLNRIHQCGAIAICGGDTQASKETAIAHAKIVIAEARGSWEYDQSIALAKTVGNLAWLRQVFDVKALVDPKENLLFHPAPAAALLDFKDAVISSTGFSDSQKNTLKELIARLGGRYLPDFCRHETTVLIAADFTNRKCIYAKKWQIPFVNVLWLEDCYLQGRFLSMVNTRYSEAPVARRAGERSIELSGKALGIRQVGTTCAPVIPVSPATTSSIRSPLKRRQVSMSLSPSNWRQQPLKRHKVGFRLPTGSPDQNVPESFKSISTTHQDDTQQIREVSRAYSRGAGIPRLRSTEEM